MFGTLGESDVVEGPSMRRLLRLAIFFGFGVLVSAAVAVFAYQSWLQGAVEVTGDVLADSPADPPSFERRVAEIYPVGTDHASVATSLTKRGFAVSEQDSGYRATLRWEMAPCTYLNVVNWKTDTEGKVSLISGGRFARCR
jgi:hypothetical protein